MIDKIQVFCFLASYAVAFGMELSRFLGRSKLNRVVTILFSLAGLAAHTLYLMARARHSQLPPLLSSPHDWLLVLSWLAVISYISLTLSDPDLAVGVFLLPVILGCVVSTYFMNQTPHTMLDALRGWKLLHASLLVLGMLGVIVGLVVSLMYVVQQQRLKRRLTQPQGVGIPNLERLARLNRGAILIAVPLLTFGFATGVGLILIKGDDISSRIVRDPLVWGSGIMWVVMVALFTRLLTTRRGRGLQVALLTAWSCGFLLVTLIGLQIISGRSGWTSWHASRVSSSSYQLGKG